MDISHSTANSKGKPSLFRIYWYTTDVCVPRTTQRYHQYNKSLPIRQFLQTRGALFFLLSPFSLPGWSVWYKTHADEFPGFSRVLPAQHTRRRTERICSFTFSYLPPQSATHSSHLTDYIPADLTLKII